MKQMKWKELPHAGTVLKAGNANEYKTGSWRSFKPRWIEENCIQCLFCWIFCPDTSVTVKDGQRVTRLEWNDPNIYVFLSGYLRIRLASGDHDLIVSTGDMLGTDWVVV